MASITFVVPGKSMTPGTRGGARRDATAQKGTLKHSVSVAALRGEGAEVRVSATIGQDVVVLHVEGGPSLILHPENARDLLLAQTGTATQRGARPTSGEATEIHVPPQLQWQVLAPTMAARGGSRGRLGAVLLKGLDVISDAAKELAQDFAVGQAQSLAASLLVSRVDAQVEEGVYRLDRKSLPRLKSHGEQVKAIDAPSGAPALVLVHGTFSNTNGTFSKLWTEHPGLVDALFSFYGSRVFALDHRTLAASPITNALTLVKTLPKGASLHVVTHSRGGLVGEVLAHVCGADVGGLEVFEGEEHRVHRAELEELIAEARQRKVTVERLVRVACPARGTLLASKRIDAYLSILKWSLELSGIPVLPEIVDFLNGVAQYRADPTRIPGLAAQIPDSPLVRWLHDVNTPIPGELRVVAGDMAGDSIMSWLKTLLADAFYWTDNDLVVQTRSMYGGTPRAAKATFVLDRGGDVSHFAYFGNADTAGAIVNALTQAKPATFRPIGPFSQSGKDSSGTRAAKRTARTDLPAVIVVPGIFGSHLADKRGRLWLNWDAPHLLPRLAINTAGVEVDGLLDDVYGELSKFLLPTHEVIQLAYDWRQPIRKSAMRLGAALNQALNERKATGQPVRILAHSSGSLVVRALQLVENGVWDRWLEHDDARLLMLGPPNAGFWMPMQVLSGDDTLGGLLAFAAGPFREQQSRQTLAELPGLIDLQAGLLDDQLQLSRESRWRDLAHDDVQRTMESTTWHTDAIQRRSLEWGIPPQALLDNAVDLHAQLDQQRRSGALRKAAEKIVVVAGRGSRTPSGYETNTDGLQYVYTDSGDAYVAHDNAALPGAKHWVLDVAHARLPATAKAFGAYLELLQRGTTAQLTASGPLRSRQPGEAPATRQRPARTANAIVPPTTGTHLLGEPMSDGAVSEPATLRVTVINGDLSFIRGPVLLGHYQSSTFSVGAEAAMDRLIGGAMSVALRKGHYPNSADSRQIFVNTRIAADDIRQVPRPEAVIVVGLGDEGKLDPARLVHAIKHGVIAWAHRVSERRGSPTIFDLAATLIGSGGIGLTAGQSAQLVVKGVLEANDALAGHEGRSDRDRPWPRVAHLSLIELYMDRASEAWRALQLTDDDVETYALDAYIDAAQGALPRPLETSYRGANYDFIRAATQSGPDGLSVAYTLDTKRARTETRAQPVQADLLRSLIGQAADDRDKDRALRRTLFRLLVPVDLEPFLTGDTEAQLEVDSGTAGIPWELLDDSEPDRTREPWAIRTKLLRKLRTAEFRGTVTDADANANVLVIGEPACDLTLYPRLSGAREEAKAVADALTVAGGLSQAQVVLLRAEDDESKPNTLDARRVMNAVMARDWRIVHIAGHGEPPELIGPEPVKPDGAPQQIGNPRGVVLSDKVFLGPHEINSMRVIPELVFINCCHLAARDKNMLFTKEWLEREPRYRNDRATFASGVADALIKVGVRCVIAAGWAVDDSDANVFARTLYEHLLQGHRFIDAVQAARMAAWKNSNGGGNTWAAYQCYGDPDWVFRREVGDAQRPSAPMADPFTLIASARGVVLALHTIGVRCELPDAVKDAQLKRIEDLRQRFQARYGRLGRVAEAFAVAYAKAGDEHIAVEWYTRALQANDGGASVKAAEQRANLQIRLAWKALMASHKTGDGSTPKETKKKQGRQKVKLAGRRDITKAAIADAKRTIEAAVELLKEVAAIETTMERASLLGSAYKRLAIIAALGGDATAEAKALRLMQQWYKKAEQAGLDNQTPGFYYPALNCLSAEFALRGGSVPLDPQTVEAIREDLDAAVRDAPDFWNVVSQSELRMYEALSRRDLAADVDKILAEYDDLHLRVPREWYWGSVYDQASFVLSKYVGSASSAEKSAAARVLQHLARLSGQS